MSVLEEAEHFLRRVGEEIERHGRQEDGPVNGDDERDLQSDPDDDPDVGQSHQQDGSDDDQDGPLVQVDPQDMEPLMDHYARLKEVQFQLSNLVIEYENKKDELISTFESTRQQAEDYTQSLREQYVDDPDREYTLNLPDQKGKPGIFSPEDDTDDEFEGEEMELDT